MTVQVRPVREADYPRFVETANTVVPEYRQSVTGAWRRDGTWDQDHYHRQ